MKVSRISAITLMVLFLMAGICFSQSTGEYPRESVQPDSEAKFEEEYVEQVKQLVKGLEYSDKVAEDFVQMVMNWKDKQGRPVLVVWKEKLSKAKEDYKQGKISKAQPAKVEESIAKELSQRIRKEISPDKKLEFFDLNLADVVKHKQAQCLGYSQLVYIVANSVGLSVKAINAKELMTGQLSTGHIACIIGLPDSKMTMIDLFVFPDLLISKPFELKKEFMKVGNYWELKNKENPLGIHRRIQILDRNGLIAAIYINRGNVHFDSGQVNQAILDYTKAIELNPKYAEAYNNRGKAYAALDQANKTLSDFTRAIELNPKNAEAYSNRGLTYAILGKSKQAKKDLLKAVELNPALKPLVKKISDHFKLNLKLE